MRTNECQSCMLEARLDDHANRCADCSWPRPCAAVEPLVTAWARAPHARHTCPGPTAGCSGEGAGYVEGYDE
jgi:hypothetical protein